MGKLGNVKKTKAQTVKKAPAIRTVQIKMTMPAYIKIPFYQKIRTRVMAVKHKKLVFGGGLIVFMFLIINVVSYVSHHKPTGIAATDTSSNIPNPGGVLEKGTPEYTTVLPAGKTIEEYGGWTRVSPADKNPVYAYADKIGEIPINVSQQPLPPEFQNETEVQINQLALGYKASEKITVGDTTIHIGTSANGPQSVIFARGDLLVLIKSSSKISSDQWVSYISSLQ